MHVQLAWSAQFAQAQLQLFLSTVLAGAGVTDANVTDVTESAIVYSLPEGGTGNRGDAG